MWLPTIVGCGVLASLLQAPPRDHVRERSGTAVIRGRVVDRDSGQPLPRVNVRVIGRAPARGEMDGDPPPQATTDGEGRYEVTRLPAGAYSLIAEPGEYRATHLPQAYGEAAPLGPNSAPRRPSIELAPGEVRSDVNFELSRALAINGRVVDEFGEPMANVDIEIERVGARGGGYTFGGRPRSSDDRGMFRVFGLHPGAYRVCADPRNFMPTHGGPEEKPLKTCYPGTTNLAEAQPIQLTATESGEVLIRIVRGRTFTASGVVLNSSGAPVESAQVSVTRLEKNRTTGTGSQVLPGGRFVAAGLLPGEYSVEASIGNPYDPSDTREREAGATLFRIDVTDVDGLVVMTRKAARVTGHVRFEDAPVPPNVGLSIQPHFDMRNRMMSGPPLHSKVGDHLTFELAGLLGPVTLMVGGIPHGWALKSIQYRGTDITDVPTEFTSGSDARDLEIVLTSRPAELMVRVLDDQGNPMANGMVMVFPADPKRWTVPRRAMPWLPPGKDGTFSTTFGRAGDYLVVAVSPEDMFAVMDEPDLARLAKVAERVTVIEGDRRTIDVRVAKLPVER